jgi:TonB family protein
MTSRRGFAASSALLVCMVAGAATAAAQELPPSAGQSWQLAGAFPESQPGPLERTAKPVTSDNPIPRRTRLVRPPYPPEAAVVGARATVRLRLTLDHLGTVSEVRTLGGPLLGAVAPGSPSDQPAFSAGLLAIAQSATDAARQWLYDPPVDAPIAFDVVIGFTSEGDGEVIAQSSSRAFPEPPVTPQTDTVPLAGSAIRPPVKTKHVNPVYPAAARDRKITGVVILEARIEPDGRILDARVLRSIPELDDAALDAVRQWEFTPTVVNGVPAPVTMTMTIQFSLP